jgi:hypothetical protein
MVATFGVGTLGCAVIAGAISGALGGALDGHSVGRIVLDGLLGGAIGALTAGLGNVGGAFIGKGVSAAVSGLKSGGREALASAGMAGLKTGAAEARTAFGNLGLKTQWTALRPKNFRGLVQIHQSTLGRPWARAIYGKFLAEEGTTMVGSGLVAGVTPTDVDGLRSFPSFSLLNAVSGTLTGF